MTSRHLHACAARRLNAAGTWRRIASERTGKRRRFCIMEARYQLIDARQYRLRIEAMDWLGRGGEAG